MSNELIEVLDTYRGFTITTRIRENTGVRIYLPNGDGILDFADSVAEAYTRIDQEISSRR